jgi:hypothetical protein
LNQSPDRRRLLETTAVAGEDLGDRSALNARRWVRFYTSFLDALAQISPPPAVQHRFRLRVQDALDHLEFWRQALDRGGNRRSGD